LTGQRLRPTGVTARLAVAFVLVATVALLTAGIIGTFIAPSLFHHHLHEALPRVSTDVLVHADDAFASAYGVSLGVALFIASASSVAAGAYLARRLARSVAPLATAAEQLAAGRYDVRATGPSWGHELEQVTAAFNDMADRLERTETTRRRLFTDLAHEMRTPVATLTAYLDGVQDGVTAFDEDTVAVLRAEVSRLARLAEDMSVLSRAEEGQLSLAREPLDPRQLVESAVKAAAERYATAAVELRTDIQPGMPPVAGDADRLGQVLANLLGNALRHTPAGGTVTVQASTVDSHSVRIRVVDTGTGIAAEDLPHVFERFYRAGSARDRATGGSGIGLTITRAIVEAHGGRVHATSGGAEDGTTLTVLLPLVSGTASLTGPTDRGRDR
jgi:two-component system, OmpR family, sensor histidine kinase BaeS